MCFERLVGARVSGKRDGTSAGEQILGARGPLCVGRFLGAIQGGRKAHGMEGRDIGGRDHGGRVPGRPSDKDSYITKFVHRDKVGITSPRSSPLPNPLFFLQCVSRFLSFLQRWKNAYSDFFPS